MVNTEPVITVPPPSNGTAPRVLPEAVTLSAAVARRIPSPGTQRALRAQTGRSFDDLCGEAADGADRIQTLIWMQLRKSIPDLHWEECEDVEGIPEEEPSRPADPTQLSEPGSLPASAASGG
jgi:hypothetical protein